MRDRQNVPEMVALVPQMGSALRGRGGAASKRGPGRPRKWDLNSPQA